METGLRVYLTPEQWAVVEANIKRAEINDAAIFGAQLDGIKRTTAAVERSVDVTAPQRTLMDDAYFIRVATIEAMSAIRSRVTRMGCAPHELANYAADDAIALLKKVKRLEAQK